MRSVVSFLAVFALFRRSDELPAELGQHHGAHVESARGHSALGPAQRRDACHALHRPPQQRELLRAVRVRGRGDVRAERQRRRSAPHLGCRVGAPHPDTRRAPGGVVSSRLAREAGSPRLLRRRRNRPHVELPICPRGCIGLNNGGRAERFTLLRVGCLVLVENFRVPMWSFRFSVFGVYNCKK